MITRTINMGILPVDLYPNSAGAQYVTFWKQTRDTGDVLSTRTYHRPNEDTVVRLVAAIRRAGMRVSPAAHGWSASRDETQ